MIYINAHLAKAHEGPHADTADDQGVYPVIGQKVYGHHATALGMFLVGNGGYRFNFSVFNIHKGEYVTMSEMACTGTGKSPFTVGGDCNSTVFHNFLFTPLRVYIEPKNSVG
jgi:hypothetical protein